MTAFLRIGIILTIAVLAWFILADWLPGPMERFYLLLPPAFLAMVLTWSPASRRLVKQRARGLAMALGIAFLFCCFVGVVTSQSSTLRFNCFVEAMCGVYFLLAVGIVVGSLRFGVRSTFARLAVRTQPGSWTHSFLTEAMPLVVLVMLVAPYLMGVSYVHRFKAPPASNPLEIYQRQYDDVEFRTRDHLTLRGWFIPAPEPSSMTLLVCHGLGANREMFIGFQELADRLGANTLFFDFRGHGASDGHTVSLGLREKEDVLAAIAYLRCEHPDQCRQLIGLGVSMGAGALVLAAAEVDEPLHGLILDSGMASACELTDSILDPFPKVVRPWLTGLGMPLASLHAGCALQELRPEQEVCKVRAPVFVIHSQGDRLIPPHHGQRVYNNACHPKAIFLAPTTFHADVFNRMHDEYLERVAAFLGKQGI